jgi:O-antigen ligase
MLREWRYRLSAALTLGTAILAPVPFGSQPVFWNAIWLLPLGAALLVAPWSLAGRLERRALLAVLGLWAAIGVLVFLQIEPLESGGSDLWREAAKLLETPVTSRRALSAVPPDTALLPGLAASLAFLAGLALPAERFPSRTLLRIVSRSLACLALLWLFQFLQDPGMIFHHAKTHHRDVLTGTFFNRNMACALAAFGFVAAIALISDRLLGSIAARGGTASGLRLRRHDLVDLGVMLICLVAMLLTRSRAGLGLGLFGAALVVMLNVHAHRIWSYRPARRLILATFALLALAGLALVVQMLGVRLDANARVDESRLVVYATTWRMALDHPWIGTGFGTFELVFPIYRSAEMQSSGIWDRAHNTYLQLAAEGGLPFLAALTLLVLWLYTRIARPSLRDGPNRLATIFATGGLLMPILHSLVDYPTQIPGYAIPVAVIAGAAIRIVSRGSPQL